MVNILRSFIETVNLCFSYLDFDSNVLDKINLKIDHGEFISIVGGNGSGKSTLAKIFNGLITPTSGIVVVSGIEVVNSSLIFEVRKQVGVVFQNPDSQIVATLVEEDVAFAMENLCYSKDNMENRIDEVLNLVDMKDYKKALVYNLSGGQKQRVAIAGVLAMRPSCVVFDEATSMLDPEGRRKIFEIMKNLNEKYGTTIINITHNMEEVVGSNRVIVLNDGKILKDCSPKQLFVDELVLKKSNLKCLPVTELVNLLANEGLLKKQVVFDVDECVGLLYEILKGKF